MEQETTGCLPDNMEASYPPTDLTALTDQVQVVARARERAKGMTDHKKAMYDEFISKHTEFFADVVVAAIAVSKAEDKLRELTIKAYNVTGNKQPAPGLGIREVTKLDYDPKEALKWAKSHDLYLKLDDKKFKDYAKGGEIDFVTITTEIQATIAAVLEIPPVKDKS